jgi:hypothetical protein
MDMQFRFLSVNSALARETRAPADYHLGRTSREIAGELSAQIEPTYDKVLETGKACSVVLVGQVRDTPETGYWLDHCFPIFDSSGRVQQLGLFVVNVTAERASAEILSTLGSDPKRVMAENSGLLAKFDQSIALYHWKLKTSMHQLSCRGTEPARRVELFRSSMQQLDAEISGMRELIYRVISQFSIPSC